MRLANPRWRAIIVSAVLVFLLSAFRLFQLAQNAFFVFAAAGVLIVLATFPPAFEGWAFLGVAALSLAKIYRLLGGHFGSFYGAAPEEALAFAGLAGILLMSWKAIRDREEMERLMTAAVLPVFAAITAIALGRFASLQTGVYDLYLYKLDDRFGGQASALVARWFHALPLLRDVCATAYQALPLMLIIVIAAQLKQRGNFPVFPVMVFGLAGLVAPLLYRLVPAVGPEYVFGPGFAYGPRWISGVAIITPMHAAPANSMPSLHFAWALLALWNIPRKNRMAILGAAVFALVIALATLGLGEHYAIDLVVAVPFAVCVQSTCMGRWKAAILCGAITLGWLCYLRFLLPHFEPTAPLVWAATAITVFVPCRAVRRRDVLAPEPASEENFVCTAAAV